MLNLLKFNCVQISHIKIKVMTNLKAKDVNNGLIFTIVQFVLNNNLLLAVCVDEKGHIDTYSACDLVVINQ